MSGSLARALAELRAHCRGEVLEDEEARARCARDFGGMRERMPALVLRVREAADVPTALRVAAEHELQVTARGAGHSQAGQGLGEGLVLDMTGLDRVLRVEPERSLLEVEAGASWRKVVDATFAKGLLPVGLTHALDTTVAGTLSVAGVGAESFRVGAQADNVSFLEVALVSGEVKRCSLNENRELFDAVRAGIGQCAVILRVGYPLRACKSVIRVRCFAYREVGSFLRDAAELADPPAVGRWLATTLIRDPFRAGGWLLVLLLGQELEQGDGPLGAVARSAEFELPGRTAPTWTADGLPGHGFFHLFGPSRRTGASRELNPWVEHILSSGEAAAGLETLIECGTQAMGHGRAGVIFVRRGEDAAPLFVTPPSGLLAGIGLFASFFEAEREAAESAVSDYARRMQELHGKRYLSGYVTARSLDDWIAHYGDAWPGFLKAKKHCDPSELLNRGFIPWS